MEGRMSAIVELKVSASKLWEAMIGEENVVPNILPDYISSVNYIKGHGNVGSIRRINFGPALSKFVTYSEEKIDVMNPETRTQVYSIIGGELLNYFTMYKITIHIVDVENQEIGCKVNWCVEYKSPFANMEPPNMAKDGAIKTFKTLEAYIANKNV